jgi:hypothetical protein
MNLTSAVATLAFSLFASGTVLGQQRVQVKAEENSGLTSTLSNVTAFTNKQTKAARASFFVVNQGSGSAKLPESDEAASRVLVVVSEDGEHAVSSLFSVGPFYNPVVVTTSQANENYVFIKHGPANGRKTNKVVFTTEKVIYQ